MAPNFVQSITVGQSVSTPVFPVNGTTTLHLSPGNPDSANAQSGITVTDNLPAGLAVATPNGLTGGCTGATISAASGSNSITISGFNLAADAGCDVFVDLVGTAPGVVNNSVSAVSNEGGAGNPTVVAMTVVGSPTLTASFGAASVPLSGGTSLTYTLQSPNTTVGLTGIAFTDTLPAGLTIATPNGVSNSCGGTVAATAGTNNFVLSGASLPASGTCTIALNVIGTAPGLQVNTTSMITSNEGGAAAAASATLDVVAPPSLAEVFGPSVIGVNGVSSLGFTLTAPAANSATLTGVGFVDLLPAGLVIATPNGLSNGCAGAVINASAGSGTITMTGGTLLPNAQCMVVVDVTATSAGSFPNPTGAVSSANGGSGAAASATLTVVNAPTIAIGFGAPSIPLSGSTTLTFTLNNPNASGVTGLAFNETLPAALVVATPNALGGTCSGTITALAGSNAISLSGGTLAASSSCTITVGIHPTAAGTASTTTGPLSSTESGVGPTSNTTSVTVVAPPSVALAFTPATVAPGGTSALSFTITNPNGGTSLSGVGVTDTLPAALTVATPNGLTGSCGAGTITAAAGGTMISLSGGTIIAGAACTFTVNIASSAAGSFLNTTANVTSTNGGNGNAGSATLTVTGAPTIAIGFGAPSIPLSGSTTLTFTLNNPNASGVTGLAFNETLPAGLVVATPNALGGTCSGTITALAGSNAISLSGGTLAAASSCTITVGIHPTAAGTASTTTGPLSSTESGVGPTSNTTSVTVVAPPAVALAFTPATVAPGATSALSFTITNPNGGTSVSGVGVTDTLPAGLTVATPNGLTGSCGAGTITATSGGTTISLSGGTIIAGAACTFTVNIASSAAGSFPNTTANVTSTNGGAGNAGSATLDVVGGSAVPDLTITKTHSGSFQPGQTGASYLIDVSNVGTAASAGAVTVTDALPAGLTATAMSGAGWTCSLAPLACTRNDALAPAASYPQIVLTVDVASNAPASVTNQAVVSGGGETNAANDTASDPTQIVAAVPLLSSAMLFVLAALIAVLAIRRL